VEAPRTRTWLNRGLDSGGGFDLVHKSVTGVVALQRILVGERSERERELPLVVF